MAFNPLTTNLTPLVAGATAAASLANLALVIPQTGKIAPENTKGYQPQTDASDDNQSLFNFTQQADPLLFHYEGENTGSLESDITDHFVEDNTTRVDQIGLRPEVFTVSGFIGELNNVLPLPLQVLQTIANNLILLNAYVPKIGVTAQTKLNQAVLLYESAQSIKQSAVSAWSSIASATGLGGAGTQIGTNTGVFTVGAAAVQNEQQQMFQAFYGYWNNRTLFNIQTPWAILTNMAIKNLRAIQDAETRMITNFEVTFKKIRTANSESVSLTLAQARLATASAAASSNGTTSGGTSASQGPAIAGQ